MGKHIPTHKQLNDRMTLCAAYALPAALGWQHWAVMSLSYTEKAGYRGKRAHALSTILHTRLEVSNDFEALDAATIKLDAATTKQ